MCAYYNAYAHDRRIYYFFFFQNLQIFFFLSAFCANIFICSCCTYVCVCDIGNEKTHSRDDEAPKFDSQNCTRSSSSTRYILVYTHIFIGMHQICITEIQKKKKKYIGGQPLTILQLSCLLFRYKVLCDDKQYIIRVCARILLLLNSK